MKKNNPTHCLVSFRFKGIGFIPQWPKQSHPQLVHFDGQQFTQAHSLYLKVTYLLRTDFYFQLQPLASIQQQCTELILDALLDSFFINQSTLLKQKTNLHETQIGYDFCGQDNSMQQRPVTDCKADQQIFCMLYVGEGLLLPWPSIGSWTRE